MSTLLAVYNSEGCVGRCDARCYLAHEDKCVCICGGRNHGIGLRLATDNARKLAEVFAEGQLDVRLMPVEEQLDLFPAEP